MDSSKTSEAEVVNLLVIVDQRGRQELIQALLASAATSFLIKVVSDYDAAVSAIKEDIYDVFIIDKQFQGDRGLEINWEISSRTSIAPTIIINKIDSKEDLSEAVNLGADAYGVWDQLDIRSLERLILVTISRKKHQGSMRERQDELIKQVMDLEDSRERYEAQGAEYIQMAEELALAQSELLNTLAEVYESREELEQLNQEKDKFFSIIAHDLKSPFNGLLGLTELMAGGVGVMDADGLAQSAKLVHESATNVYKLLENLLEWARLQMDQMQFVLEDLELDELIAESVAPLEAVAREKEILIVVSVEKLKVNCDWAMINTVIRNFINNAIKYTKQGGTIKITAEVEGNRVKVGVIDNGIGMNAMQIENLFNIGTGNSTQGTNGEIGTGLGLLLCKDFIGKHNGEIGVESKPGEGSCFSFTLELV